MPLAASSFHYPSFRPDLLHFEAPLDFHVDSLAQAKHLMLIVNSLAQLTWRGSAFWWDMLTYLRDHINHPYAQASRV